MKISKYRYLGIAGVALTLSVASAPAQAEDSVEWNGVYLGVFAGWQGQTGDISQDGDNRYGLPDPGAGGAGNSLTDTSTLGSFASEAKGLKSGGVAGAMIGYNVGDSGLIFGLEGDIGAGLSGEKSVSATNSAAGTYAGTVAANDTTTATGSQVVGAQSSNVFEGSVRARVGVTVTPSVMIFGTGGATFADVDRKTTVSGVINFTDKAAATGTHTLSGVKNSSAFKAGWTAGGGVEAMLSDSWLLRAEYRYVNYGSDSVSVPVNVSVAGTAPAAVAGQSASVKYENQAHSVRVGLSYKF